jgi:uncharacterized membrane protein YgcG
MKNKFIKLLVLIMVLVCFFSLVSCSAASKVISVVETAKANATAETLSSESSETVLEIGDDTSPDTWVKDDAGIFKQEDIDAINSLLTELEKKTTVEVAIVSVKSLDGKSIEIYANELFSSWGIGKKDVNNGVLFLVAPNEMKCRIEVGYGMEKVITDVIASHIIDEVAIPRFKNNEYSLGAYEVAKKLSEEILAANK